MRVSQLRGGGIDIPVFRHGNWKLAREHPGYVLARISLPSKLETPWLTRPLLLLLVPKIQAAFRISVHNRRDSVMERIAARHYFIIPWRVSHRKYKRNSQEHATCDSLSDARRDQGRPHVFQLLDFLAFSCNSERALCLIRVAVTCDLFSNPCLVLSKGV